MLWLAVLSVLLYPTVPSANSQTVGITWNGMMVANNSLVTLSVALQNANLTPGPLYPLVCQGIAGGQWYEPNGVLYPAALTPGDNGQLNVSAGVQLYHGYPYDFPHGVQCCTNTSITLCVGMYSDLTLAASVNLSVSAPTSYALSVAATYGPNITGGVQFQLLKPTNIDPPVFQLTCTSTSSPTTVQWTFNGSPVNGGNYTSSQIVTDGPTSTYNNTLTVTGRSPGMYTCNVTTTCSPVCGATGFTLNPRSTTSSLNVPAPPGPPTGVTAVQSGPTSVSVSWTAPTSGGPVSRYDIYYVANGVSSTIGGSTTSTSYVLTNLEVGVQYNISVIAVGAYLPSQGAWTVRHPTLLVGITGGGTTPTAGSPYTLTCTVPVIGWNGTLTIQLTAPNGGVLTSNVVSARPGMNYTLQRPFSPLHTSDGGQYSCVVSSPGLTTVNTSSILNVTIPSPRIVLTPTPTLPVPLGANVNLTCDVQLDPSVDIPVTVVTTWFGPGGILQNGSDMMASATEYLSTLILTSLIKEEAGSYMCSVTVTARNSPYVMPLTQNTTTQVSILVVTITSPNIPLVAGQSYTLYCNGMVLGNTSLTPQVTWSNPNGVVNSIALSNGSLTFNPLHTSHGGKYTCQSALSFPFSSTSADINIIVQIQPPTVTIISTPITTSYYAGTSLNLTCTVQLIPQVDTPVVFNSLWTGPGGQISSGVGRVSLSSGVNQTTVQFNPLNTTDTGVYNCSVSVSASGQQYVDTSIAAGSSITPITVQGLPAPQVTITPSGSSTAGSPYTLTCTVMVVNGLVIIPQVMWLKNGASVVGGNGISVTFGMVSANITTLILQFNPLHTSNGGQYSCIANAFIPVISITSLHTTSSALVIVQIPPPTVNIFAVPSQVIIAGNKLTLTCVIQLDPSVDSTVMVNSTWTAPGGATLSGSNPSRTGSSYQSTLMLLSVQTGTYTCSAYVASSMFIGGSNQRFYGIKVTVVGTPPVASSQIGAMAGGTVGGLVLVVVLLAAILVIIVTMRRRRGRGHLELLTPQRDANATALGKVTSAASPIRQKDEDKIRRNESESALTVFISVTREPIPVAEFFVHVGMMHANQNSGFREQFEVIPKDPLASHLVADSNPALNRYMDIYPYDHNRVALKQLAGIAGSDYCNASFIDGLHRPKTYIAAQGPLRSSVSHFLRMLIEHRLATIVMLTRCIENGKAKCEQYWPKEQGGTLSVDNLSVLLVSVVSYAEYEVRRFTIRDSSSNESPPLDVTHFHYTGWPDHGVPSNAMSLVHFGRHIRKFHPISDDAPLVVHCSAGVGRTGTFIALDMMVQAVQTDQTIDIYGCVRKLRSQRVHMVQSLDQYIFIHDSINELLVCGDTEVITADLRHVMNKLQEVEPEGGVSGFEKQYKSLEILCQLKEEEFQHGKTEQNKPKNRYSNKVPRDSKRVYLYRESYYINASFVDGYHKPSMFIATQVPLPGTVADLWRMVLDYKCSIIVQLYTLSEGEREDSGVYWPSAKETTLSVGPFQITQETINTQSDFTVRKLHVVQSSLVLAVTQYHYTTWAENGRPNLSTLLEMMSLLNKDHSSSGCGPVIVMCNDGMGRTGTFIAIHSCLEQMREEGTADVLHIIKGARTQRPGLVQGVDQYKLCHEALLAYVDKFDTYANFNDTVKV